MTENTNNPFDKLPEDNEIIEHYEPTFLKQGGDHLVYEVKDHPNVVIKASTFKIKDILVSNAEQGIPLDEKPETMEDWSGEEFSLEDDVAKRNEQIETLRESFGKEHTLKEKRFLMKVPVTSEILKTLFDEDEFDRALPEGAEDLTEVWTVVVVQEKAEVLLDTSAEKESLNFGSFVEKRKQDLEVDAKDIKKLNEAFVKRGKVSKEDIERFKEIQNSPEEGNLIKILEKAAEDKAFKKMLEELIDEMMGYAEKTGNILALAGNDNVTLFKKGEKWDYLLVDAIPVHHEPMFEFTREMIHRAAKGEDIWEGKSKMRIKYEKELMMKTYNFVRTINGLAAALGMNKELDHLTLVDEEDEEKIDLETLIK